MFKLNNIINIIESLTLKVVNVLDKGIETTLTEIDLMEKALVTLKATVIKGQRVLDKVQGILN